VSGNKFYKLRYYIEFALAKGVSTVASFGGPFSNHIVALAYTAKEAGLKSIGYIRTNADEPMTPSLKEAKAYGMELVYLGRTDFQSKKEAILQSSETITDCYYIDEGGYGNIGAKGAATILTENDTAHYDYMICAVGTGTMMAGIIKSAALHQKIIGISVLKNNVSIDAEIKTLLTPEESKKNFEIIHGYDFGGYAKHTPTLINFMNDCYTKMELPLDFVYTAKLAYAVQDLASKGKFEPPSKILLIHSGGLQGNRSFKKGTLLF
jgi:1-aminocyclopropane-1-carboxylate deaminase